MQREYGCRPEDILAAIGPSICQECYEVSEDVAEQFQEAFPVSEHGKILKEKGHGKYLLNLWAANALIFREAGILPAHISYPGICTCCNPGFYSPTGPVKEKGEIWQLSSDCAKSIDLMHKFQGCFFVNIT